MNELAHPSISELQNKFQSKWQLVSGNWKKNRDIQEWKYVSLLKCDFIYIHFLHKKHYFNFEEIDIRWIP
jgi:hypothetical protein